MEQSNRTAEEEGEVNRIPTPSSGTLDGIAPSLTYTPNIDFVGSDSFTFKANDGAQNVGNKSKTDK